MLFSFASRHYIRPKTTPSVPEVKDPFSCCFHLRTKSHTHTHTLSLSLSQQCFLDTKTLEMTRAEINRAEAVRHVLQTKVDQFEGTFYGQKTHYSDFETDKVQRTKAQEQKRYHDVTDVHALEKELKESGNSQTE